MRMMIAAALFLAGCQEAQTVDEQALHPDAVPGNFGEDVWGSSGNEELLAGIKEAQRQCDQTKQKRACFSLRQAQFVAQKRGQKPKPDPSTFGRAHPIQAEYHEEYVKANEGRPFKNAVCDVGEGDGRQPCKFRLTQGDDGSFEIDVAGVSYYFGLLEPGKMMVERYTAALVPLGELTRDKTDGDCWKENGGTQTICVW